jgi:hypothetical protein
MIKGVISKQFLLEIFIYEGDVTANSKVRKHFQAIPNVEVKLTQVKFIEVPEVALPSCWQCQTSL